jgi:hypothetical protein
MKYEQRVECSRDREDRSHDDDDELEHDEAWTDEPRRR